MPATLVRRTMPMALVGTLGVLLLVLLPMAAATSPNPSAQPAPDVEEVAGVLADQLDAAGIPGGAVVTVTDDGDVRARGVGTTGDGDPVTARTPFVIGSTTKSFTALAVMQLVEAGEVDLESPVVRYVPEFRLADGEPIDAVTVRHLLQHTSGLDDLTGGPVLGSASEGTALEAVAELEGSRLASAPGETWRYANANYVLAGLVIENVSGQSYAQYLQDHVLDPLGMTDTHVAADPAVAPGHRYWFGIPMSDGPVQREGVVAAGYLASTAEDLGAYLSLYLRDGLAPDGGRLVSAQGIRTLTTPGPEAHLGPWAEGASARYAMGWMVGGPWAEPAVFHPGNSPDSSAMIALFPERGLAAASLVPAGHELPVPGNPSLTDRISRGTLHAVVGEDVPDPVSRWTFYAWFDAVCFASVTLGLLVLVRAARAYGRPAPGRLGRWLRPVPALLVTAALLGLPALTSAGWAGVWTWAPDLAITLVLLTSLAAATGALRLAGAFRSHPEGTGDRAAATPQPHVPV